MVKRTPSAIAKRCERRGRPERRDQADHLTYDLRSGSPDFVDRLVAFTFAGMAMDALEEGKSGLMTALNEGRYAMVTIPDPKLGPRKVDIGSMYNTDRYRPKYDHKLGLPIFLTRP
jgi:ATP-dependent phosphofructokinase / diphosphate-dependent phosphofructokinase